MNSGLQKPHQKYAYGKHGYDNIDSGTLKLPLNGWVCRPQRGSPHNLRTVGHCRDKHMKTFNLITHPRAFPAAKQISLRGHRMENQFNIGFVELAEVVHRAIMKLNYELTHSL